MKSSLSSPSPHRIELGIVLVTIVLSTLAVKIPSYDSAIVKAPLLISGIGLMLAVYLARAFRQQHLDVSQVPASVCVAFLLLFTIGSALLRDNPSVRTTTVLLEVTNLLMFFVGLELFTRRQDVSVFIRTIALLTGIVSLLALLQFFLGEKLPFDLLIGREKRVTSTLGNPAFLSGYLALTLPVLLTVALAESSSSSYRFGAYVGTLVTLSALILTQTRSSILGAGAGVLLFLLMLREPKHKALLWGAIVIAIGVVALSILLPNLPERFARPFAGGPASSFARRLVFWEGGLRAFFASPVFGYGIGSFEQTVVLFRSPDYWMVASEDVVPHAHNEPLEIAVNLGAVGLSIVLAVWFLVLKRGQQLARSRKKRERLLSMGLVCGLVALAIDSLANVAIRQVPTGAVAWLFMGLLTSSVLENDAPEASRYALPLPKALWITPLVVLPTLLVLYWRSLLPIVRSDTLTINGILAGIRGQREEAVGHFQGAVKEDSLNLTAWSNLGSELVRLRRPDEVLEAMRAMQENAPNYPKSNLMQAWALNALKRYPEGLAAIRRELRLRAHPDAYLIEARSYNGLGDTTNERQALEMTLRKSIEGMYSGNLNTAAPRLVDLTSTRAEAQRLQPLFERLEKTFPSEEIVLRCLGAIYVKVGDAANAERLAKELKIAPP